MNKIFIIRHAESESNAGIVFEHQNIIKITNNGRKQAEDLLQVLEKPDKIICSKYIRTIETAEPLMNKFPESEIHLWIDVYEFQPLNSEKYKGITKEQRDELVRQYWLKMSPFYNDGGNAESFKDFVERVNVCILRMKNLTGINYIFTHSNFIRCVVVLISFFREYNTLDKNPDLYLKIMKKFTKTYHSGKLDIKNAEIFNISDLLSDYI